MVDTLTNSFGPVVGEYLGVPVILNDATRELVAKIRQQQYGGAVEPLTFEEEKVVYWEALIAKAGNQRVVLDQLGVRIVTGGTNGLWFEGYDDETYGPYPNMEILEAALLLHVETL